MLGLIGREILDNILQVYLRDNVQAYECYLRARQETWLFTKEALDHAKRIDQVSELVIAEIDRLLAASPR